MVILSTTLGVRRKRKGNAYYSFTRALLEIVQILKSQKAILLLIFALQKISSLKINSTVKMLHEEIMKNRPSFTRFWDLNKSF